MGSKCNNLFGFVSCVEIQFHLSILTQLTTWWPSLQRILYSVWYSILQLINKSIFYHTFKGQMHFLFDSTQYLNQYSMSFSEFSESSTTVKADSGSFCSPLAATHQALYWDHRKKSHDQWEGPHSGLVTLSSPLWCVNQPKAPVTGVVYHMVITANVQLNRMGWNIRK